MADNSPRLYGDLAGWYHLLTAPHEYVEEAGLYRGLIREFAPEARTILELGTGGGANASHLKTDYQMTLTDISEPMLDMSRRINPDCEHLSGDMRTIRLDGRFDVVMIHDAIDYMTTDADLSAAIETAALHCIPGGIVLLFPDHTTETFEPGTDQGGHDDDTGRGLRYVEWTWDPDPSDTTYLTDYAYLLRDESGKVEAVHDRHTCGLFSSATWIELIERAGLEPHHRLLDHSEAPPGLNAFVGRKRI
ncbi:MAG TPA: class I SAM-dependent methyltransferase [Actinomycetota bacterium]|nr:class I SAM-dependent methyltransferase [Actinomycetota bacterium]